MAKSVLDDWKLRRAQGRQAPSGFAIPPLPSDIENTDAPAYPGLLDETPMPETPALPPRPPMMGGGPQSDAWSTQAQEAINIAAEQRRRRKAEAEAAGLAILPGGGVAAKPPGYDAAMSARRARQGVDPATGIARAASGVYGGAPTAQDWTNYEAATSRSADSMGINRPGVVPDANSREQFLRGRASNLSLAPAERAAAQRELSTVVAMRVGETQHRQNLERMDRIPRTTPDPVVLKPGETAYNQDGSVRAALAPLPLKEEGDWGATGDIVFNRKTGEVRTKGGKVYTLAPGETLTDEKGNAIYTAPSATQGEGYDSMTVQELQRAIGSYSKSDPERTAIQEAIDKKLKRGKYANAAGQGADSATPPPPPAAAPVSRRWTPAAAK